MGFMLKISVDTESRFFLIFLGKMRNGIWNAPHCEYDGLRFCAGDGFFGVIKFRLQAVENPVAANQGILPIAMRIESRGSLGKSGEERRFGE